MGEPQPAHRAELTDRQNLRLPGVRLVPTPLRRRLQRQALAVLSHEGRGANYDAPAGDPGLFGPDSVVWKIHADFPSMMAGGLAALMLQALHPVALAGVWDHSNFRTDLLGRLRRTVAFVGRTTYAPTEPAREAIARVRRVHDRVQGTAPDGRPYSTNDPHLLTWVHCAESWCFLQAYARYCQPLPAWAQDRYLAEFRLVAEALGATEVPTSMAQLQLFFECVLGELTFDARTQTIMDTLAAIDLPIPLPGLSRDLFLGAAMVLLPDWALRLHGRRSARRWSDTLAATTLKALAPSIRDAMSRGGLAWRACRRTGTSYPALFHWD